MRVPFPIGGFYVRRGEARISEQEVVWERVMPPAIPPVPVPYKLGTFTLLLDFARLADGTTDDVLEFARRYGPLQGLNVQCGEREPLEYWRYQIAKAKGILSVATKLQDGELVADRDWEVLGVSFQKSSSTSASRAFVLGFQRFALLSALNSALRDWQVQPRISWSPFGARLELGGGTLLSGIGAQLVSAICRSDGFVICKNCGKPYAPVRKPRGGENHFCRDCGRKAALKLSARRFRQRHARSQPKGKSK